MIHEWTESLPGGDFIEWRMEEKENGDLHFTMSVDVRFTVMPISPGDPNAEPTSYTYTPTWPIDPNAPGMDDEDYWDWEEED